MSSNIPLVDITEGPTKEMVLAEAKPKANELVNDSDQFVLIAIRQPDADGNQLIDAVVGADDHALMAMAGVLMSLIGASRLGEQADAMDSPVASAMAQVIGFNALSDHVRRQAEAIASPLPKN